MKKNIIGSLLLSAVILSTTTPAFAAGAATSNGDITFTEPTGTVKPLDPNNPDLTDPEDPNYPGNPATGQSGALTLDVIPDLPFGSHEIESGTKTYSVDATKNDKPYLQVSDRRGVGTDGEAKGWNVSVKVSDFVNGAQKLKGAELSFDTSVVKTIPNNTSTAPTSEMVTNLDSSDSATTIFKADKGQGLGTWLSVYDPANITLTVPEAAVGTFTATLTWDLVAGPSN